MSRLPTRWARRVQGGAVTLAALALAACGAATPSSPTVPTPTDPVQLSRAQTFILGDTTFNPENEEGDVNPHHGYSGWAAVRYGLAETLFRYTDSMGVEPWLATGATRSDDLTWRITIRPHITFANGRALDAQAVKECLERLVSLHQRAAADLALADVQADGHVLTVRTTRPVPTLLAHLADPYSALIDVRASTPDAAIVVGTGPYRAVRLTPGQEMRAVANPTYWAGTPGFAALTVMTIADGNTLMMALRSGQVDAAYGLPYSTYPALRGMRRSTALTSRTFMVATNYASPVMKDSAVRRALAAGLDKEGFVRVLGGNGQAATGPFPAATAGSAGTSEAARRGDEDAGRDDARQDASARAVSAPTYDPRAAAAALEQAGWRDTNGDGVRDKDGRDLEITWLTYPTRQELPLLAQWAQENLEGLGFRVRIVSTSEHVQRRTDPTAWDVYASAMVTDPTGDPAYFFTTRATSQAVANYGGYRNTHLDALAERMETTFDAGEREALGAQMAQQVIDDGAFVFVTHLSMSLVSTPDITGLHAHPSDVYEVSASLRRTEGP